MDASPSATDEAKPDFLQPAYPDLGSSLKRPPRPPTAPEPPGPNTGSSRGAIRPPEGAPPQRSPLSSRASSPRRRVPQSPVSGGTPRGSSRGASSRDGAPSSAGSLGVATGLTGTGLNDTAGSGGSLSEMLARAAEGPEASSREDLMKLGYLPAGEYAGIMELNKELREQNKRLRAELVNVQVEQQKLRMEDSFLRESALKSGLEPPPEVPPLSEELCVRPGSALRKEH
mmetsp:Transcript_92232/g.176913  ORF Transcript_92232/g.176913 Transcript_92232/m.176913 type:complete len:229 (+) Transcript_92232:74-760(+)